MKLILKLRFHTHPGQTLLVAGKHPVFGDNHEARALPLNYLDAEFWQVAVELPPGALHQPVAYHYILRQPDGTLIHDLGRDRRIEPSWLHGEDLLIVDSWNAPGAIENAFYTKPFRQVLLRRRQSEIWAPTPALVTHRFHVKAPLLEREQTLCLLGNSKQLDNWSTVHPILLKRSANSDYLTADLDLTGETGPLEYKYGVFDCHLGEFLGYEAGENRRLNEPARPGVQVVMDDGFAHFAADTWRGAGVAIPVFSLRSESGFGIGEFTDLKLLVDWCRQTGLKIIQILPVNDTTATRTRWDSYPYAAISAFALHPIYLNLNQVVSAKNQPLLRKRNAERLRLNALPDVDYEAVMRAKWDFLREIAPSQQSATFHSAAYKEFFAQNRHWLLPYAMFCSLRDKFGTTDFNQWPMYRNFQTNDLDALLAKPGTERDGIQLHCFVQFHLHRQLQEAAAYAHDHGVILKGDIAIGVNRHGADTWQQPGLYHLDMQAGAPPDAFAAKGQNWGFPTYNWPRMTDDGFDWWRRRFEQMSHYYDAFRIDHILGFFRIWSIPAHAVEGILGYFVPAIPVELDEFAARGITFDRARFTQPFITDAVLNNLFGTDAETIREHFLERLSPDQYALKPPFASQRQVEQYFARQTADERGRRWKEGLFDLISNVLLLETPGGSGRQFHFRFNMELTASFRALDPRTQERLRELYVDYFFRRQNEFWRQEAMQKLPALQRATNLLICGEDLGFVPACVPDVLKQLGILSLEIQRMPKAQGRRFARPSEAPHLSVVSPSTHDMSTLRGWWEESPPLTQCFFNEELGQRGPAPATCTGDWNTVVVAQHLSSPAMWSIFQLQDLLGMDETSRRDDVDAERINAPANPKHVWRYRMHLTLEQLLGYEAFNRHLHQLLQRHGR